MLHRTPGQLPGIPGAVTGGQLIHTSGMVDPDALAGIPRTADQQARAALDALLRAVDLAGGSTATVLRVEAFLSSRDHAQAWDDAYRERWPHRSGSPARTTIVVELLTPDLCIELQATASADVSR